MATLLQNYRREAETAIVRLQQMLDGRWYVEIISCERETRYFDNFDAAYAAYRAVQ